MRVWTNVGRLLSIVVLGMMIMLTGCDSSNTVAPDPEQSVQESESVAEEIASRDWVTVPLDSLVAHGLVDEEAMKEEGIETMKGLEKYTSSIIDNPSSDFTFPSTGTYQAVDGGFSLDSDFYDAEYIRWSRAVTVRPSCASSRSLYYQSSYYSVSTVSSDPFSTGFTLDDACDHEIEASSYEEHYFPGYGWKYESTSTSTVTAEYQPPPPVTISGPVNLDSGESGTWTANVNFGSGSTSYQWYYMPPETSTWYTGGTGSSYTHTFYTSPQGVELARVKVEVTRGGETEESTPKTVSIVAESECESDPTPVDCPVLQ